MKPLLLSEILPIINGNVVRGPIRMKVGHVTKAASSITANTLYFNVRNTDISQLARKNNSPLAIVTERFVTGGADASLDPAITVILVSNIMEAYFRFVDFYRALFSLPVIGVTGTAGKTTTKEMIRHILSGQWNVRATYRSENGLALNLRYLTGIDEDTQAAVFEMGVSHPGNIRYSGRYFKPQVGVITNIGVDHLVGCKTEEGYLQAKAEMLEALSCSGTLLLNTDDKNSRRINTRRFTGQIQTFGFGGRADFRAADVSYTPGGMEFFLHFAGTVTKSFIPGYGMHQVANALSAVAACHAVGVDTTVAIERLNTFLPIDRHLRFFQGPNQSVIIDDTWNCNYTSMKAALTVLRSMRLGKRKVAVLGKFDRLGDAAAQHYERIAKMLLVSGGYHLLITVDEEAERIGRKAIELGISKHRIIFSYSAAELENYLHPLLQRGTVVLCKMPLGNMHRSYTDLMLKLTGSPQEAREYTDIPRKTLPPIRT